MQPSGPDQEPPEEASGEGKCIADDRDDRSLLRRALDRVLWWAEPLTTFQQRVVAGVLNTLVAGLVVSIALFWATSAPEPITAHLFGSYIELGEDAPCNPSGVVLRRSQAALDWLQLESGQSLRVFALEWKIVAPPGSGSLNYAYIRLLPMTDEEITGRPAYFKTTRLAGSAEPPALVVSGPAEVVCVEFGSGRFGPPVSRESEGGLIMPALTEVEMEGQIEERPWLAVR